MFKTSFSSTIATAITMISISFMAATARAQLNWEEGLAAMEKRHVSELLKLYERQTQQLDVYIKKVTQSGDVEQANRLSEGRTAIQNEEGWIKLTGQAHQPPSNAVQAKRVATEAQGKFWTLKNTTNIQAVVIRNGAVYAATPEGLEYQRSPLADTQLLPRLFHGLRSDGNGSAYVLSPDLKQLHAFIYSAVNRGVLNKNP